MNIQSNPIVPVILVGATFRSFQLECLYYFLSGCPRHFRIYIIGAANSLQCVDYSLGHRLLITHAVQAEEEICFFFKVAAE